MWHSHQSFNSLSFCVGWHTIKWTIVKKKNDMPLSLKPNDLLRHHYAYAVKLHLLCISEFSSDFPVHLQQPWCAGSLHASVSPPTCSACKFFSVSVDCLLHSTVLYLKANWRFPTVWQSNPILTGLTLFLKCSSDKSVNYLCPNTVKTVIITVLMRDIVLALQENGTPQQMDSSTNSSPYSQLSK